MSINMVNAALRYLGYGFSVIPCKKDKRPYIKWEEYQRRKPTEDEVKGWWSKWPDANIGLPCGEVSGVDVLDVDTDEAYQRLNETAIPESLKTPVVKTPKGRHLYFLHRPGLSNAVRVIPGTDIRTSGGYVIAPPSRNGEGNAYAWLPGLAPKDCAFSEWPDDLFGMLVADSRYSNRFFNEKDTVSSWGVVGGEEGERQDATDATKYDKWLMDGTRDEDMFHIANCLTKGHCEKQIIYKVLEIVARSCVPPFTESEVAIKIKSAMDRRIRRERNLAADVREWVDATNGDFCATDCDIFNENATKSDKRNINKIFERMSKGDNPLIEKAGTRNGWWRRIDRECQAENWVDADCRYIDMWLPLQLGEVCGVQHGNILVFAGAKDSGKTAFMMNIAKENRSRFMVHYFNSEMGKEEFRLRVGLFDDITPKQFQENFKLYNKSTNLHQYVKKGKHDLNIIDYLETPEDAYRIGGVIRKIYDNIGESICVICIQKKFGAKLGRGSDFSLEKARLYVGLENGKAEIVSCKNFKQNSFIHGNPRGMVCNYKLVQGCRIIKSPPGWFNPPSI